MGNILRKDINKSSPKEQLDLFSEDNKDYIQSIKKNIDNFLSGDNLIFSDKNIQLYLTEKNIEGDIIHTIIVCNLTINEKQKYFQLKCIVDTLKKYVYCEYKGKKAKQIEGLKVNIPFMIHLPNFIGSIIDSNLNIEDYKYATKKPKDLINKEVKNKEIKYPDLNFSNNYFENKEENKYNFFFTIDNIEFRITNVEVSTIIQNNGNHNDISELNTFNKHCLYNIGMKIGEKWNKFNYKDIRIEKYIRDKISTHIFNTINSYEFKKSPEKVN